MLKHETHSDALQQLQRSGKETVRRKPYRDRGSKQGYLTTLRLLYKSPERLQSIPELWNQIEERSFSNQQLSYIIHDVALAIYRYRELAISQTARQHVEDHIELWASKASANPAAFDDTQHGRILLALEKLEITLSHPPRSFTPPASSPSTVLRP